MGNKVERLAREMGFDPRGLEPRPSGKAIQNFVNRARRGAIDNMDEACRGYDRAHTLANCFILEQGLSPDGTPYAFVCREMEDGSINETCIFDKEITADNLRDVVLQQIGNSEWF